MRKTKKQRVPVDEYRFTIRMPRLLWERAAYWAGSRDRSVGYIVREAIQEYVERKEERT